MGRHEGAGSSIARLRSFVSSFALSQELGGKAIYLFSKVSVLAGIVDATANRAKVRLRRRLLRREQKYPGRKARKAAIAT
jgi:hypothetical protein